jgi:hypothetical protein
VADKKEAFRNAVAPASVAAEEFRAVEAVGFTEVAAEAMGTVAGIGNRRFVTFLANRET